MAFCQMYRSLRRSEQPASASCIHRFAFEDLVYRYEETRGQILTILGLPSDTPLPANRQFDPARSIYNTQLFTLDPIWAEEAAVLERELEEWLYTFPSPRPAEAGGIF